MKRVKSTILSILIALNFTFCASGNMKIGIISDPHYLSEQLMHEGFRLEEGGRLLSETPEILDKVLNEYLLSDIDFLFIAGDITRNGEKQSHIDFVNKLQPLIKKGIRIFVVPGNHDINIPSPEGYPDGKPISVENISAWEFETIYYDCGFAGAIYRDEASLSYIAALDEKNWLLALDGCKYDEHTTTSISSGRLKEQTEKWVFSHLTLAQEKKINVIAMMHHGLVEHFMLQDKFFPQYLIDDWERLANLFADNGVKAIFTGHFHANDITSLVSDSGNTIYDIETGSLSSYPYPYRFAELSANGIKISTKNVKNLSSDPDFYENGKLRFKIWAREFAKSQIRKRLQTIPENTIENLSEIASEIIMEHAKGDEVITEEIIKRITDIANEIEIPVYIKHEDLQLDLPPEDNNTEIKF